MFFKFFKNEKNDELCIKEGSLVKIKDSAVVKDDKSYFIVINQVNTEDNQLTLNDEIDDTGMIGIVWGINEDFYLEEMKREIHLRLWNHELDKFLILSQKYVEEL